MNTFRKAKQNMASAACPAACTRDLLDAAVSLAVSVPVLSVRITVLRA